LLASRSLQRAQRNNRETFKHDRAIIGKQLQAAARAARKDLVREHGAPAIGEDLQRSGVYQDVQRDLVVARAQRHHLRRAKSGHMPAGVTAIKVQPRLLAIVADRGG